MATCMCYQTPRADPCSVQKFLNTDLLPSSEAEKILMGSNTHERVSRLASNGEREPADRGDVARVLEAAAGLH